MEVKIVVINKGEGGESCEVYEYHGDELKLEISEQKEPDKGQSLLEEVSEATE